MGELGNLRVSGEAAMNGGNYDKVKIMGTLTLAGNVDAKEVSVMGSLNSECDIACDKMSVMGEATMKELTVRDKISIMGSLKAKGVVAETCNVRGELKCEGDISCAILEVRGAVNAKGLINAEKLVIKSKDKCSANELGGKSIKVRNPSPFGGIALDAKVIEFDEIDLDYTEAEVVRGKCVTIGNNCKISLAEYSEKITQNPGAQVGNVVKI